MASGKSLFIVFLTALAVGNGVGFGQKKAAQEPLFSPLVAGTFHKTARHAAATADERTKVVAKVFLEAAVHLDARPNYLYADLLTRAAERGDPEEREAMIRVFGRYIDKRSDFAVLRKAVRYFLSTTQSREARQQLLLRLFEMARESNPVLASELISEYAELVAETANTGEAAKNYEQAWYYNKYNQRAFLRFDELLQKEGRGLSAAAYAHNLRLAMDVNPVDIDKAFAFAQYCERVGIYDVAALGYEYTADLFNHLNPDRPLPASIYLPWAIACYNTPMSRARCLEIAAKVRKSGRFDLRMEGLAGAAAKATGNAEVGQRMLDAAGRDAARMLGSGAVAEQVTALQLGWFYAFANPSAEQALAWANRALTAEPDLHDAQALFGYVVAMTEQYDLAEDFVKDTPDNQIAALTRGMIELSQKNTDTAIAALKEAVALDPGSLAAGKARALLEANGSEYIPAASPQVVRRELEKEFGERVVGPFRPAADIFSAKLNFGGSEFSYGSDMESTLVITNTSGRPLVIADDAILRGGIRVDADVRGDVKERIERLIDTRVVPSMPVAAGEHAPIPLDLMTGRLRTLLLSYPQASVEIEFTVYLDPVVEASGEVRNALSGVSPVRTVVKRQGVVLTRDYVMQRLDALARGQEGQKIRAAELFAGLLVEQDHMTSAGPLYRYIRLDRPVLLDAVKRSLADENWKVRIEAMKALTLAGKLDYELTRVMSSNLNDERWPVRLMAVYLLSKSEDGLFGQVLDWSANYDSQALVREMAIALGGTVSGG
ncbi:MAG: HEAT repeat domain-containing protein [Phycisphaerae bacterium]|nr:HEAT repeat domain-containing protein [Phycisphaerae bacterium]